MTHPIKAQAEVPIDWGKVPKQVQAKIFGYLNEREKTQMWATCRYFTASNSALQIAWQHLCLADRRFAPIKKPEEMSWKQHYETLSGGLLRKCARQGDLSCSTQLNTPFEYANAHLIGSTLYIAVTSDEIGKPYAIEKGNYITQQMQNVDRGYIVNDKMIRENNFNDHATQRRNNTLVDLKTGTELIDFTTPNPIASYLTYCTGEELYLSLYHTSNITTLYVQPGAKMTLNTNSYFSEPDRLIDSCNLQAQTCGYGKVISRENGWIKIYDTKGSLLQAFDIKQFCLGSVNALSLVEEHTLLFQAGEEQIVKIDLQNERVQTWPLDKKAGMLSAFTLSGNVVISGSELGIVQIWSYDSVEPLCTLKLSDQPVDMFDGYEIKTLQVTEGKILAQSVSTIKIWEIQMSVENKAKEKESKPKSVSNCVFM